MRDRFLQQEVWERMGVNAEGRSSVHHSPTTTRGLFQQMLFSKIVPNCKKLGLLDAADGWLRDASTELGVIQFEDWARHRRGVHRVRPRRRRPEPANAVIAADAAS